MEVDDVWIVSISDDKKSGYIASSGKDFTADQ